MLDAREHADDWFADDHFWATTYDVMFPAARFDAAAGEVEAVLALAGGSPERVLDMACGPGRHASALAARGLSVVGVDRSPFLLAKARERAGRDGIDAESDVEWVQADMRTFIRDGAFDLVLNLFTSFGYFADDADNERVLANAYRSLKPGGAFVLDVMGKEVLARVFSPSTVLDVPGGMLVQRRAIADNWSRIENTWTCVRGEETETFQLGHWVYSGRELARMLVQAGFGDIALYGDFEGAPYGPEASRLVAVARRG